MHSLLRGQQKFNPSRTIQRAARQSAMNFCEAIFPQRKGPSKLFRVPQWRKGTRDSSSSLVDIDDDFTTAYYYTYVFAKTNLRRESRQKFRSSFFCVMMERPMIILSSNGRSTFFSAAALSVFKKTRRGSGNTTNFCGGSLCNTM